MIKTEVYDNARAINIYTLSNQNGMSASFIALGAAITSLNVPDANGKSENVVLELKDYDEYLKNASYIGVVPGRFANRISNCKFTLDGVEYTLNPNDGKNSLHGGPKGFSTKIWQVASTVDGNEPSITFEYLSPDGDENFPGNLTARVTYLLSKDNELKITYSASTDKATPVNLTQHAYFNLSGNYKNQSLAETFVEINADNITENASDCVPTGVIMPVEGTIFDLRKAKDLKESNGFEYDHNYCLNDQNGKMRYAGSMYDPNSKRFMEIFTDFPGMQFYSGNFLDGTLTEKSGKKITRQSAACFETQMYPDSPNKANFPTCIVRPGENWVKHATFKFSVK